LERKRKNTALLRNEVVKGKAVSLEKDDYEGMPYEMLPSPLMRHKELSNSNFEAR
jgi:hypothetical protein